MQLNAQLKPETWIEEPKQADRTGEISAALAKAQCEMHNPGFDSTNPHFKNKFASLAAVRNAVVPVLAKYGIAMSQDIRSDEGGVSCTTHLLHSSGQRLSFGPLVLPVSKNDAQGFGSAATYARRYTLMAVCGVVGDDDDDANAAVKPKSDAAGDVGASANPQEAKLLAIDMVDVMAKDVSEEAMALSALDLHSRVRHIHDLYIAASELLTTKERASWKKLIEVGKKLESQDKAIEAAGRR